MASHLMCWSLGLSWFFVALSPIVALGQASPAQLPVASNPSAEAEAPYEVQPVNSTPTVTARAVTGVNYWMRPLRKALAIALGTSARTTLARLSCTVAFMPCSTATAGAPRISLCRRSRGTENTSPTCTPKVEAICCCVMSRPLKVALSGRHQYRNRLFTFQYQIDHGDCTQQVLKSSAR